MDPSPLGVVALGGLAAEFPTPDLDHWRALAAVALKGDAFERLVRSTADGVRYGPLHTAHEATPFANPRARAHDRLRPWDLRTLVDHPHPARANAQALDDLQNGAASILIRLRRHGVAGVDCKGGADLERVLDGVHTDHAPIALDAGDDALEAAQWLSEAARRGPAAPLAFHIDPLGTFAREGVDAQALEPRVVDAGRSAFRLSQTHGAASFFLANGRVIHEAGGTEAQELGFAAASALAYARSAAAAGMDEAHAWSSVVFGLAADPRTFIGMAKFRAARAIGSRIARAIGGDGPIRIEAYTAERTLTALDPWNNLVRTASAACGAVLGRADALIVAPFTAPLTAPGATTPDAFARRQARNLQLVLMEEAHLGRVADPGGGSWFVEHLTDGLARAGWKALQEIEADGGALATLRSGRLAREVALAREALARRYADRRERLVGVSEFVGAGAGAPAVEALEEIVRVAGGREACGGAMPPWRAAADFERLRRAADDRATSPHLHLVQLDSTRESAVRLNLARSLVAVGGVTIGAESDEKRRAVVLCGSDRSYEDGAADAAAGLRAQGTRAIWIVAPAIPPALVGLIDGAIDAQGDLIALLEALQAAA